MARVARRTKSRFLTKNALRCTLLQRLRQTIHVTTLQIKNTKHSRDWRKRRPLRPVPHRFACRKRSCRITVNFLERSRPHNAAAHVSRRMRQGQKQETQIRSASTAHELTDPLTIQKANMNCSGAASAAGVDAGSGADGCRSRSRSISTHLGCPSMHGTVTALVVARVSISHANASLFKAAVALGGFPFIMPREFRGPAYHS